MSLLRPTIYVGLYPSAGAGPFFFPPRRRDMCEGDCDEQFCPLRGLAPPPAGSLPPAWSPRGSSPSEARPPAACPMGELGPLRTVAPLCPHSFSAGFLSPPLVSSPPEVSHVETGGRAAPSCPRERPLSRALTVACRGLLGRLSSPQARRRGVKAA